MEGRWRLGWRTVREGGGRYGREKKEERKLEKLSFFVWKVGGYWDEGRCGKVVVGMGEKIKKKESLFILYFFFIDMVGE